MQTRCRWRSGSSTERTAQKGADCSRPFPVLSLACFPSLQPPNASAFPLARSTTRQPSSQPGLDEILEETSNTPFASPRRTLVRRPASLPTEAGGNPTRAHCPSSLPPPPPPEPTTRAKKAFPPPEWGRPAACARREIELPVRVKIPILVVRSQRPGNFVFPYPACYNCSCPPVPESHKLPE